MAELKEALEKSNWFSSVFSDVAIEPRSLYVKSYGCRVSVKWLS